MNKTQRKLRAGVALHALALVGASAAMLSATAPAHAQDYTSGAIQGTVTDETGAPVSGATVTVTSTAQGVVRTATTAGSGNFTVTGLPVGKYDVAITSPKNPSWRAEGVSINPSQTAQLNVQLSSAGGEEIVVTGSSVVPAFAGTTTGLNVDIADFVKTRPIGRDLTSVILLAPGTTGGDSAFGNLASINGSSVGENAYYVNGLNITNFDNYLGSAPVPFEFYRAVEVKTGGIPAEYGRATGGIVNAVSKSGTNEFTAAMHMNWSPNSLRDHAPNLQSCSLTAAGPTTLATRNCVNSTNRGRDTADSYSVILEAGGPIIKDKLFVYGLGEFRRTRSTTTSPLNNQATSNLNDDPFWGAKIDAYPISTQHLEFTIFDTRSTTQTQVQDYNDKSGVIGATTANSGSPRGGVSWVGKYTGQMTDWLTVSAAYGIMRDRFLTTGGSTLPYVVNSTGGSVNGVVNGARLTPQTSTSITFPYDTQRKFFRADADLFFSILGDHHVRFGYDQENNVLNRSTITTGGAYELSNGLITQAAFNGGQGNGGVSYSLQPGNIAQVNYYSAGGSFKAKNVAYYAQDEWKLSDKLTVNLGVRRDDFGVKKPDGTKLVQLDKNYAPRLGFTYDLWGNKKGSFYGSYGWYFLPVASNTSYRQASGELFFNEWYNYNGVSAAGIPNLTSLVTNDVGHSAACPIRITPLSTGQNCAVTGNGQAPDTTAAIAANLKATKESEFIIGYDQKVGNWTLGINFTHRNLDRSAEDVAIDAAVLNYCQQAGLTGCASTWTGFHQYTIVNPGSDVTVNLLGQDGRQVKFTAAQLGYPKAKRTYDAVTLTARKEWNGRYTASLAYTWSKSKGNSEGFVQSDFGQADAGITQDFDQPGFITGAYGYLPNDRRHLIKFNGAVALNDDFTLGTNVQVYSQRPLSCFGYSPRSRAGSSLSYTDFANGYGAASHYCNNGQVLGTVLSGSGSTAVLQNLYGSALSPRGTAQKSDWYSQIDLSARYNVHFGDRVVTLRADVFNLLNSSNVMKRNEVGDQSRTSVTGNTAIRGVTANQNYGQPTVYQSARSVRLGFDISF